MPEEIQIRLVHVEFLRPGPPHNQLLSPLTAYLAISGDAGAGVVTVPYEHAEFERRLKDLCYETGDSGDRQAMLHTIGVDMGKILGSVPGLPGALAVDANQSGTLIHLRVTLSASELALLPFEVAKVPISANTTTESWLSVQTRPPVCLTRNIRTVSPETVAWPDRPRILFVAGDQEEIPYGEHRRVLLQAIQPFRYPGRDERELSKDRTREQFGDLLTILINPTLTDVFRECRANRYTHVHILTHGDLSMTSPDSYGLVLRGDNDSTEVVSGEQFASALTSVGDDRIHRPTVVTVASCNSGNVGTVVIPGASFAHALHQSGVPLVVASQFPLSKEGSVPLAATLYEGLLWGKNPLVLLQQLRAELHARYTSSWHDWVSLVAYEALPQALSEQLDALQYSQTKRAINAVLERIDNYVARNQKREPLEEPESLKELDEGIERAVSRLPLNGQYAVECIGIRASSRKRLSQAAFTLPSPERESWRDPYQLLDEALLDYERAVGGLLVNQSRAVQRVATLHWVLVQVESLSVVLGKGSDEGRWKAAKLCADLYKDHVVTEERAWACGSLAELWLLRLGEPQLKPAEQEEFSNQALQQAREMDRLYPRRDEFPIKSTRRQFERYVNWWGTKRFEDELASRDSPRPAPWEGEFGLLETAKKLVRILRRRPPGSSGHSGPAAPPISPGPSGEGGSPAAPSPGPAPSDDENGAKKSSVLGASAPTRETTQNATARRAPFFDIEMLPAGHGDALWIEYGDGRSTHRWLIDCGTQQTAKELLRRVAILPATEQSLELFVMSHIDSDHIGGALGFFKAVKRGLKIADVWFNGWRHLSGSLGAKQGEMFSTAIEDLELPWNAWREGGVIVVDGKTLPECTLPGGMKLTLLSPTPLQLKKLAPAWMREMKRYGLEPGSRVDYSRFLKGTPSTSTDVDQLADSSFVGDAGLPNGTSIAVLAEFNGVTALLAADAHVPVLTDSIRTLLTTRGVPGLKLDVFKVSHHASQYNLSAELLQLLDCPRYLVSTNGNHFSHPDREAIARIIKYGGDRPSLYFNYRSKQNEVWARPDLQEKYKYLAHYPEGDGVGSRLALFGESP